MNIRELRKETGMTQQQFADRFGIAIATLRRWEQRVSEPPAYLVPLIKQVLNMTDCDVILGKGQEKYYYNRETGILCDSFGNSVKINSDLSEVKKENLMLYITDLFTEIKEEKNRFEKMCDEDKRSDIIWIER